MRISFSRMLVQGVRALELRLIEVLDEVTSPKLRCCNIGAIMMSVMNSVT